MNKSSGVNNRQQRKVVEVDGRKKTMVKQQVEEQHHHFLNERKLKRESEIEKKRGWEFRRRDFMEKMKERGIERVEEKEKKNYSSSYLKIVTKRRK